MNSPIGTGTGSRDGCRDGFLIFLVGLAVLGVLLAVLATGLSAVLR